MSCWKGLTSPPENSSSAISAKFICRLKLLGLSCFRLYLLVSKCLSNTKMNFSAALLPYLNHLSSLSLPVKMQSPLKPRGKKKKCIVFQSVQVTG